MFPVNLRCQDLLCLGNPRHQDCLLSSSHGSQDNARPIIWEAEVACSTAIRDVEAWRASRLRHSKGNMATSCKTWSHKSSERRAEAKLTSSPPARPLCTPAHWSSRALWLLLTTSYWGRHLHHLPFSYCRGLPQWKNSLLQLLLPHQCPSSLLGPKDGTLPQIPWRACLWVEPLQSQPLGERPAPSSERSHPGTEHSS